MRSPGAQEGAICLRKTLAAAGSATAASALAVIMFPVEALGAFNISIFGLHGRRPGRYPVAPSLHLPHPQPACAVGNRPCPIFGKGATSKKVVSPVRPIKNMQVRCKAAFCLYPSFLYTQLRRIDHVRDHRTLPNTNRYQLQSLVYLCLDPQPAIHRPPGSTCQ
jgi:hypothetical protein